MDSYWSSQMVGSFGNMRLPQSQDRRSKWANRAVWWLYSISVLVTRLAPSSCVDRSNSVRLMTAMCEGSADSEAPLTLEWGDTVIVCGDSCTGSDWTLHEKERNKLKKNTHTPRNGWFQMVKELRESVCKVEVKSASWYMQHCLTKLIKSFSGETETCCSLLSLSLLPGGCWHWTTFFGSNFAWSLYLFVFFFLLLGALKGSCCSLAIAELKKASGGLASYFPFTSCCSVWRLCLH